MSTEVVHIMFVLKMFMICSFLQSKDVKDQPAKVEAKRIPVFPRIVDGPSVPNPTKVCDIEIKSSKEYAGFNPEIDDALNREELQKKYPNLSDMFNKMQRVLDIAENMPEPQFCRLKPEQLSHLLDFILNQCKNQHSFLSQALFSPALIADEIPKAVRLMFPDGDSDVITAFSNKLISRSNELYIANQAIGVQKDSKFPTTLKFLNSFTAKLFARPIWEGHETTPIDNDGKPMTFVWFGDTHKLSFG